MNMRLSDSFQISSPVSKALAAHKAVVALESTVLTHGLPYPDNLELAIGAQEIVNSQGAVPATTSLLEGKLLVGMDDDQLEKLVHSPNPIKVSARNLGIGVAQKRTGGTTVAGTLVICRTVGIQVFATGGIGGVHRGSTFDLSSDLDELARSPVIVVCAGAKSILDLPATLEALETRGVPVIGFQTDEFPAFYSRKSGLPVDTSVESAAEVVEIATSHWALGLRSAVLVCVPPPVEYSLDSVEVDSFIKEAIREAENQGVSRSRLTPFLLEKMNELTHGQSLQTNLALLHNNVSTAAKIVLQLTQKASRITY
jgi:pseudouridine-5'-phosphate glycosidase